MERQTIYLLSVNDFIFLVELERHVSHSFTISESVQFP